MANKFYKDHVGIPIDNMDQDYDVFESVDGVGDISVENSDEGENKKSDRKKR